MNKLLLSLAASVLAVGASALTPYQPAKLGMGTLPTSFKQPTGAFSVELQGAPERSFRAEGEVNTMDYTPAYDPYNVTSFQNQSVGMKIAQAFEMTDEVVQRFAGNQITGVFFYTGYNPDRSTQDNLVNTIQKATLFLAYDLQNFEPFYTQEVNLPSNALTLQKFNLTTPYTIEADKPVYVGFYYALSSVNDATIIFDYMNHGNDVSGGWCGIKPVGATSEWQFDNYSDQIGFFCVGATLTGTTLPQNEMSVLGVNSVVPSVYENEQFAIQLIAQNDASNVITSIEVSTKVGDNDPIVETFNTEGISYNQAVMGEIEGLTYGIAGPDPVPVTVTVTKINGNDNTSATPSATGYIQVVPAGKGFDRNVVIEEFTGTWCGYCPQGILTMEAIPEHYPNGNVIPVAVHNGDDMVSSSYKWVDQKYSGGSYPSAILNRYESVEQIFPAANCFAQIDAFAQAPAPAKVTANAAINETGDGIVFDTKTSFAYDMENANEKYVLAFGLTENKVGPYNQHNYFTSDNTGALPGFSGTTEWVSVLYNDVARQYNNRNGVNGSVPANVVAGQEYDYHYNMKILASTPLGDINNLNGVVYLINKSTGMVENACMVTSAQIAGIEGVEADSVVDPNAPVEYFNLQGIRIAEPTQGLYIRRQGSKAQVVLGR